MISGCWFHRPIECPTLEGTHRDHRVQLLDQSRTTQKKKKSNSMSESITQALLELWQLEAVTTALGEQSEPFTRRLYFPCWPDDQLHTMRHNAGAMSVRRSSIAKSLKAHRAVFQQCHPEVKERFSSPVLVRQAWSHIQPLPFTPVVAMQKSEDHRVVPKLEGK